jgi:hypothetical protein
VTHQPYKEFIFFRDFLPPNPRPRKSSTSVSFIEGEKPFITTFGRIYTIFVVRSNEVIIDGIIEPIIGTVDKIQHNLREGSIQHLRPMSISGDILNRKMEVMDVNDGDKGSKGTKFTPRAEPEGRRTGSRAPRIA